MRNIIVFLFTIFITLFSCKEILFPVAFNDGDFFFLEHKEAIMPIWVKGNLSSKTFCVFLHGGPGLSSLTYANSPSYEKLQEKYAFVFWDQRSSGASLGNTKSSTINLAQFVEDTDKVIDLILEKYEIEKVILIGKSWGGALGTAYLIDEDHQQKVSGWVEIDGTHNWKEALVLSVNYMKGYSQGKIDNNDNTIYWEESLCFYNDHGEDRDLHFWKRHGKYLNAANAIYKYPKNDPENSQEWSTPIPLLSILNAMYVSKHMLEEMSNLNLTPEMNKIKVPTLILWGRYDFNIPVETGYEAYDVIGTAESEKELFIFEESAHSPSFEEPELFVEKVVEFIELFK